MALREALRVRQFEIDLYWTRAKYFTTLIGATLLGYGALGGSGASAGASGPNNAALMNHDTIALLLACIGFVLSFAWLCVNRGSKYWQINWERHVAALEDPIMGPLHKTTVMGSHHSVSGINEIVSQFAVMVWVGLILSSLPSEQVPEAVRRIGDYRLGVWAALILTIVSAVGIWTERGSPPEGPRPGIEIQR